MIEVAHVEFVFNNHELISLLKKRGTAITNLDFDKLNEVEETIRDKIKNSEELEERSCITRMISKQEATASFKNWYKPVAAFITFETDDGKVEAISYSRKKQWYKYSKETEESVIHETLFNKVPKFKQATEPTNIIWENRHIKGINYCARVTSAMMIAIFMLTITFWTIFAFKQA